MTVEEIAKLGNWRRAGDIGCCDVTRCIEDATKSAEIATKNKIEAWYFCDAHFAEYLRVSSELREKARAAAAQPDAA